MPSGAKLGEGGVKRPPTAEVLTEGDAGSGGARASAAGVEGVPARRWPGENAKYGEFRGRSEFRRPQRLAGERVIGGRRLAVPAGGAAFGPLVRPNRAALRGSAPACIGGCGGRNGTGMPAAAAMRACCWAQSRGRDSPFRKGGCWGAGAVAKPAGARTGPLTDAVFAHPAVETVASAGADAARDARRFLARLLRRGSLVPVRMARPCTIRPFIVRRAVVAARGSSNRMNLGSTTRPIPSQSARREKQTRSPCGAQGRTLQVAGRGEGGRTSK